MSISSRLGIYDSRNIFRTSYSPEISVDLPSQNFALLFNARRYMFWHYYWVTIITIEQVLTDVSALPYTQDSAHEGKVATH